MSEKFPNGPNDFQDGSIEKFDASKQALARPDAPIPIAYETVATQEAPELLTYWRVIQKRRWTIAAIFITLFSFVLIWTLKEQPIYEAKALLEIEKENPNILSVQQLFEIDTVSDAYLETQYKVLESESLAYRVISQLELHKIEEFNPPAPWWLPDGNRTEAAPPTFSVVAGNSDVKPGVLQQVLKKFQKNLSVEPVVYSRLVELRFESEKPDYAAKIVNTLAENYIQQNLEARWDASQKASEWLSQQLVGLKAKLESSEEELQSYAHNNGLLFLQNQQGIDENILNERLRQLQQELTDAEAARYEKEAMFRLLESGNYESLPGIIDSNLMQDLTLRLAELQREHAQLTSTFTSRYPLVQQLENQIKVLQTTINQEQAKAAERIRKDFQAANQRQEFLVQAFQKQQEQANTIAEKSVQYSILHREVETNKQMYDGLLQRLKEAGVSAGLKASNIRIVDIAIPPKDPIKPNLPLNFALGIFLGLTFGIAAAFLQEYLDNTLKTPEDVERFLEVPTLALIPSAASLLGRRGRNYGYGTYGRPRLPEKANENNTEAALSRTDTPTGWYRIDQLDPKQSTLLEAFSSLRTSILLSTADKPPRILLVTSAQPGEGKTTITLNLAISMAQLGQKVLLIDCDMRRPCLHKIFSQYSGAGLSSFLTGQAAWQSAAGPSGVPHLDFIGCGPIPPNPAELLSSDRMRNFLQEALGTYSFIIIDSPPLLHVTDGRILARLAEGTVLVIKGQATPRELARRAQLHCRDVGANVVGVILNNLDVRSSDYYYYYNRYNYKGGYGYGSDSSSKSDSTRDN